MQIRTKNPDNHHKILSLNFLIGLTVFLIILFFYQQKAYSQVGPIKSLKKKNQYSSGDIKALFDQGREFEILGKFSEAEKKFREILKAQPEHGPAHVQLGMVYKKQKRYKDAAAELKKAIAIQPNSIAHKNLGIIYTKLGENVEAVKEFEAAIKIDPDLENIHYLLGKTLFQNKIGGHQRVIKEFKEALRVNPKLWEASFGLGLVYKSQKLYKEAIPYFEKVVSARPSHADAFYQLGHMYIATKEGKSAIANLLKAEELYVKNRTKQKAELCRKYLKKLFKKYGFKRSDFI